MVTSITRPHAVSLAFCSSMRRLKHVLKMATIIPFAISDNSQYSIYSSPDGVLKLWEADNGVLKQEYTPSAHLSATCTCLSWGPKRNLVHTYILFTHGLEIWICALYIITIFFLGGGPTTSIKKKLLCQFLNEVTV